MLRVSELVARYGLVTALHGVSLEVDAGEIVCVIGPNGAGKSTLMKTLAGSLRAASGEIAFEAQRIDRLAAHQVVALGLALVPEGRHVFGPLSVADNLRLGAYLRRDASRELALVLELFPRLAERLQQPASTLSGGEQQMLAIGRALMASPKLLLLDEPSMGLAPMVVREIFAKIRQLAQAGLTILLAEQNAQLALGLARRGYVLDSGRLIAAGLCEDLRSDERLSIAYIGG